MELNLDKSTWKPVIFGDVVQEVRTTIKDPKGEGIERVVGLEHIETENIHLSKWASIEEDTTFTKGFRKGHVLFGRRRAYLKKAAQAGFDGICSGDITVMEAKDGLLPELLPFLVCNDKFFDYAVKHSAGGLSPRTKFKDLANYEFLLPPKDQQAKLAELLWAADAVVEDQKRLYLNSVNLRDSVCKNSLSYGYSSRCPAIPSGWKLVRLKSISKVNAGSTPLRSVKEYFDEGTTPWVKTLDLNNGVIEKTEESITELALKKTSCNVRPVGSVLVAMYGGWNQIGRTGLLNVAAATNQAVSAIMPDHKLVRSEFLLYLLNTNISYWRKVAVSSRKDPNITKDDVERFPVPLPSLEVQDQIVKEIKLIILEVEKILDAIKHLKQLQRSLINQIF